MGVFMKEKSRETSSLYRCMKMIIIVFLVLGSLFPGGALVVAANSTAAQVEKQEGECKWESQSSASQECIASKNGVSPQDCPNAVKALPLQASISTKENASVAAVNVNLSGVLALDANHVWAVGDSGTILFFDGSTWSVQDSGISSWLGGVSGLDANHVWAVGYGGTILFYDGSNWATQGSGTTNDLYRICALDSNHVWAVGDGGIILFYNGSNWSTQASETTNALFGVSAADANHVWAVGDGGIILFYDGSNWSTQASETTNALFGVSAADANHVWATDNVGDIYSYNGSSWFKQITVTADWLNDVYALDAGHVWVVGNGGTIYFYDGSNWYSQDSGTTEDLNGVSASAADQVWAVGKNATILHGSPTATTRKFYFAEGYTGANFDEYLCLMNAGTSATVAHITYMFTDGSTQFQEVPIGPSSRATVMVNGIVGPDRDVSVKVESDGEIVAERPMYFNYNGVWDGGHDVVGATSPSNTAYFAEGYTGANFDEYLCLMNPNSSATVAHVTYMFTDGNTQSQDVNIGGTSRVTLKVNDVVGPGKNVSVKIESDSPIVAERPMYFNYQEIGTGGHDIIGAPSPQVASYFAEGYTGDGFDEYLCLMNPNPTATVAHVTYMFSDGSTQVQDMNLGPTSRATVLVNDVVGQGKEVSMKVASQDPILAERPMYFIYPPLTYEYSIAYQDVYLCSGGHDVVGAPSPQKAFYFAEGYTGAGFEEWLCIMNPNDSAVGSYFVLMYKDGSTDMRTVELGPTSRVTVKINDIAGPDRDVSIAYFADSPVVVERPMYFFYHDVWSGGHDVIGYTP